MAWTKVPDSWKICKMPTIGNAWGSNGFLKAFQTYVDAPIHPQIARGQYLRGEPYSKYIIEVEPFGKIDVPPIAITTAQRLTDQNDNPIVRFHFFTICDVSTGDCTLHISTNPTIDKAFWSSSARIAVDVPVHQSMQDAMGFRQAMRNLHSTEMSAVTGFVDDILDLDFGSALGTAQKTVMESKKAIDDATNANKVTISGSGSIGSYITFISTLARPKIHCYFARVVAENIADKGRPLMQNKQLNTLSGFVQCSDATIETGLTQSENSQIISFLNGGFFYE